MEKRYTQQQIARRVCLPAPWLTQASLSRYIWELWVLFEQDVTRWSFGSNAVSLVIARAYPLNT